MQIRRLTLPLLRLLAECLALAALEVSYSVTQSSSLILNRFSIANAVRYGTAKGEWFLNAVSFPRPRSVSATRMLSFCVDGRSSVWGSDQDETPLTQVVSRI